MTTHSSAEYKRAWKAKRLAEDPTFRDRINAQARESRQRDPERRRAIQRESYHRHREANLDRAKARYHADPAAARERSKRSEARNPEGAQARHRRGALLRYGLTPDAYAALLEAQGGVCAICQRPETLTRGGRPMRLAVDHDHATDANRSLLCSACNRALGYMGDDPARLRAAADYLERHGR